MKPILITGAAGKTGQAIIKELTRRQQEVRAFVRTEEQASEVIKLGVLDITVGDLLNMEDIHRAAQGVQKIYHIAPNVHPKEVEIAEILLQAAMMAEVEQFGYHSVLHPQIEAMPHHWLKMQVEELIFTSGLPFTILQPCAYMQNILGQQYEIEHDGRYSLPYSLDAKFSLVDLVDVANAAAIVLTEDNYLNGIYELCGSQDLDGSAIISHLSNALNKPITVRHTTIEQWQLDASQKGMNNYAIETLSKMFAYYDLHGFVGNPTALTNILKRPPMRFEDFLQSNL